MRSIYLIIDALQFRKSGQARAKLMSVWVVRTGKRGGHAETCRKESYITICWDFGGDRIDSFNKDQLREKYNQIYRDVSKRTASEEVNQIYRFTHEMQEGDPVIMPDPAKCIYYIGEITGPCRFEDADDDHPGGSYRRTVTWNTDVPFDAPVTETLHMALDIANQTVYMVVDKVLNELKNAVQDERDESEVEKDASQEETEPDASETETNTDEMIEEMDVESPEESK